MSDLKLEKSPFPGPHSITSEDVLLCAETGRVVATFYNEYDLDVVITLHQRNAELEAKNAELKAKLLNPAIVKSCATCSGHGMIGGMTQEGGEGWVCEDCDGTGIAINPVYKAEIKAAAILKAIEKHSYSMMNFNHDFVRVCETSHLEEYAANLKAEEG